MTTVTIAPMRAMKWQTFTNDDNIPYYDIVNQYENVALEVIRSKILVRLNVIKGEWATAPLGIPIAGADPDFGLPVTAVKTYSTTAQVVSQLIADEILKVQNVSNVALIADSYDAAVRKYTGSFLVNTAYGNITEEVNI